MNIIAKCRKNDHWIKFNLIIGKYANLINFLDVHNLLFLSTIYFDINSIPKHLRGSGNTKNLLDYIYNNSNNPILIFKFVNYFLDTIIDIRYESGKKIKFYVYYSEKWQEQYLQITREIVIIHTTTTPPYSSSTTTTHEPTTTTTTHGPTTTTTTHEPTTTTTTHEPTTTTTTHGPTTTTTTYGPTTTTTTHGPTTTTTTHGPTTTTTTHGPTTTTTTHGPTTTTTTHGPTTTTTTHGPTTTTTTHGPTTTTTTHGPTTTTTTHGPTTTTTTTCDPYKCNYGLLYNFFAVDTGKLAPTGWHVPTDDEWTTLTTYLGGESVAGGKMKTTGTCDWFYPNEGATNEIEFSGLPGGYRHSIDGFVAIGARGSWWSSVEYSTDLAWYRRMGYYYTYVYRYNHTKVNGFSVRCLRDSSEGWYPSEQMQDYDGNVYDTIQIGTQIWTVQNLKTTHYNDGASIPNVEDNITWSGMTIGALCAYNNNWETYVCIDKPTTTTTTFGPIPEGALQFENTLEYFTFEGQSEYVTFEDQTPIIPEGALQFENTLEYFTFEGQSEYVTFEDQTPIIIN